MVVTLLRYLTVGIIGAGFAVVALSLHPLPQITLSVVFH